MNFFTKKFKKRWLFYVVLVFVCLFVAKIVMLVQFGSSFLMIIFQTAIKRTLDIIINITLILKNSEIPVFSDNEDDLPPSWPSLIEVDFLL